MATISAGYLSLLLSLLCLLDLTLAQLSPGATAVAVQVLGSPQSQRDIVPVVSPRQGSLPGLVVNSPVVQPLPIATGPNNNGAPPAGAATTARPARTTTFAGYLPGSPYPFVLPPPDIPYFGSKWNGPWGYPIGHYQAFRGTGQYITHYDYYPLSYFGSLMAPFAYGVSGKK